jgi:hypothetical protein
MSAVRAAILAGLVALAAGPLAAPRHVRFRLADGVSVAGELTAWDAEGIDGSFGRRLWTELMPEDAWRLYVGVMDAKGAAQWVDLGQVLLKTEGGDPWAERAFRRALELDAAAAAEIRAARDAAREARRRREQLQRTIEEQRLRSRSPEASPFAADPWPVCGPDEQEAAVAALKADAEQFLRSVGVRPAPLATQRFLVYGDTEPLALARLGIRLEAICRRLALVLGVAEEWNPFWGKAVVFVFSDHDRFRMVQAASFGQLVPRRTDGICQPVGPKVFLSFCADADGVVPAATVAHEVVHGYMHRFRTPRRLPPWANEGLADYVAAQEASAPAVEARRQRGLRFLRAGGDVAAQLDRSYDDESPPPDDLNTAVGTLLIELMVGERPAAFGPFVDAVKYGKAWQDALAEDYGVPRAVLVETFVQYYRVND